MFTALSEQLTGVLNRLRGRGVLSESDVTDALREIRRHLLEADVSFEVTRGFVERVRERAVVGLQGSGKTTTAAKLARRLKLEQKAPALVAADIYRPAAAEQLQQLGAQIGVPVLGKQETGNVVKLVQDALREAESARARTVIVDTAGRLQIDAEM